MCTGLILLDLKAWRSRTDTMVNVFAEHYSNLPQGDQSVINHVWRNSVEPLPRMWNHWAGATDIRSDDVIHYIGRVKPWSPGVELNGAVALWWAVYHHQILPLLSTALQIDAPPAWQAWSRVPLLQRFAFVPPRCINWGVGMLRLGRRSAAQRLDDLDYLRNKQAQMRQRVMWARAIRCVVSDGIGGAPAGADHPGSVCRVSTEEG